MVSYASLIDDEIDLRVLSPDEIYKISSRTIRYGDNELAFFSCGTR